MDVKSGQLIALTYNPDWAEEPYGHAVALKPFDTDAELAAFAQLAESQPTTEALKALPSFPAWLVQRGLVRLLSDGTEVMTWNIDWGFGTVREEIQRKQRAELEAQSRKVVRFNTEG